jgi:hypothetical protein
MFMTAKRMHIDGKPVLQLNIHEYDDEDIPFLDSLGIDRLEGAASKCRYKYIHSQEEFLSTRSAILKRYRVVEEKGPKVLLEAK